MDVCVPTSVCSNRWVIWLRNWKTSVLVVIISHFASSDNNFSTRCNIYILHLCYDASVRLSVCLSVTFVHCGHRVRWIPDTFACLDRWISLLLTDNASPGSSDGMMPGFLVELGGVYGKIGNCSDIAYFTYFLLMDWKHVTTLFIWTMLTLGIFYFSNLGRKCIISEERFVLELPTSRAMLATARPSCW